MKRHHWLAALFAALILLPVILLAVLVLTFNPNAYAPQIIAAVQKATGRKLTLGGPITLELSLTPTIQASAVSLANPPGFADANLLTLQKIEARFALLPLLSHRLDILTLRLVDPVLTLQRNAAGQANWIMIPPASAADTAAAAPSTSNAKRYKIALESVDIDNGVLTTKNAAGKQTARLAVSRLTGQASALSAPLNVQAQAQINGVPLNIAGMLGPVERFSGIGTGPWPVALKLTSALGNANIQGTVTNPVAVRGYDVQISAIIPNLAALAPWLPAGITMPPLRNLTASARIVDQNSTVPAIDNLAIKAGPSDLTAYRPGLSLAALDIELPSLDQQLNVTATGAINAMPLSVHGQFGPPQALLNAAWLPATMPPQGSYPVSLQAAAGAATLIITGAIATPAKLAGVALAVNAAIPGLATLDGVAGANLPAWKNLVAQATLIDPGGLGLAKAAGFDGLALTMDNAALGGDASLYFGPHPRLQAALSFRQINLDALLAARPPTAAPAPAPVQAAGVPAPAPTPAPPLIPAIPLPLAPLKSASADILLSADSLVFNHATYNALQGHAVLAGGLLTINPLTGELPGGSVSAAATVDSKPDSARETLTLRAPALALAPFLQAIGLADIAKESIQGTVQVSLNATASGNNLRDAAATLSGQLGLASVNGIIDGRVLDQLFGTALATLGLPATGPQGPVALRCFGLAVSALNGTGTIRALTLDSSRLLLQGGGTIALGPETLSLVLRPQLALAGNNVGVPVAVSGTWQSPKYGIATMPDIQSASAAAPGLSSTLSAQLGGSRSLLGALADAVGLGTASDVCPQALSLARLGAPGPPAPPPLAAPAANAPAPSGPKNLLNELLGQ